MADLSIILELITKKFNRGLAESTAELNKFKAQAKKAGRDINTVQSNMMKASSSMQGFTGSMTGLITKGNLAIAGLTALGAAGIDSIRRFAEFEKSMKHFQGILGVTNEDMKFFNQEAIRLGATTTQTASQVADAFTRIAGRLPQLLTSKQGLVEVTKASITLAEAAGITVDEAGIALADAINQMGATSLDAASYVNVLAAAQRNGAGDVNYLNEAMKKIGNTTSGIGMSFEQTAAAIEILAATGVQAGTAGRQLRGIIGNLEKQMDDNLKPSIVGINKALENLGQRELTISQYFKMFGKENQGAARALVEHREEYINLTNTITGTQTAFEQQKINTDNIQGAVTRLDSAWEELALTVSQSDIWKNMIDGAAIALGYFNDIILKLKDLDSYKKKKGAEGADEQWGKLKGGVDTYVSGMTSQVNPATGKNYTKKEAASYLKSNYKLLFPELQPKNEKHPVTDYLMDNLGNASVPTGMDVGSIAMSIGQSSFGNLIKSVIPVDTSDEVKKALGDKIDNYLTEILNFKTPSEKSNSASKSIKDNLNGISGESRKDELENQVKYLKDYIKNSSDIIEKNAASELLKTVQDELRELKKEQDKEKNRQEQIKKELNVVSWAAEGWANEEAKGLHNEITSKTKKGEKVELKEVPEVPEEEIPMEELEFNAKIKIDDKSLGHLYDELHKKENELLYLDVALYPKAAAKLKGEISVLKEEIESKDKKHQQMKFNVKMEGIKDAIGGVNQLADSMGNFYGASEELQKGMVVMSTAASIAMMIAGMVQKANTTTLTIWDWIAGITAGTATVVTMASQLKSISSYATGGIVDSPLTSGDREIIRVNGGEMILNQGQQANLFKLLNNGSPLGLNQGEIKFKLRGSDIYGSLSNYNKKMSKIR